MDQQKLASTLLGALLSLGIQQTELLLRPQPVVVFCDAPLVDLRSLFAGATLALFLLGAVVYRRRPSQLSRLEPVVVKGNGRRRT